MIIRNATFSDIDDLLLLEQECWDEPLRANKDVILQRIKLYGEGQFVIEIDGSVCGVLYTQRILDKNELVQVCSFQEQSKLHQANGYYVQLLSISVHYNVSTAVGNLAVILRDYAFQMASSNDSIVEIVAMTRCSRYKPANINRSGSVTADHMNDYINYVSSKKDPTIFFHVSGGAEIQSVLPNYRPTDTSNLGCAVLIFYTREKFSTCEKKSSHLNNIKLSSISSYGDEVNSSVDYSKLATQLCEEMISLDKCKQTEWTAANLLNAPFLTWLDSLQLLILHNWLEEKLKVNLNPTFLFQYTTPSAVQNYFINLGIVSVLPIKEKCGEDDSIAIVGVGLELSGNISNLSDLWDLLIKKQSTTGNVPYERWDLTNPEYKSLISNLSNQQSLDYGSYVNNLDMFDPDFFNLTSAEVCEMDPNQRLILEVSLRALYDSRQTKAEVEGKSIGVWVGVSNSDYQLVPGAGFKESTSVYAATSGALAVIAGRLSFLLGLRGPAVVVDTACSSSLVALQQAVYSIRNNQCEQAIVSSVNLILTPWISVAYARAGMTSSDGHCHTFDSAANGYCRGEGGTSIILKRLDDAIRDGNDIYAVIKGSAVLQDGKSASLT
eukprot:gene4569-6442_t